MGFSTTVLVVVVTFATVSAIYPGIRYSCPPPTDPSNGRITTACKGRPGVIGAIASFECLHGHEGKVEIKGSLTCTIDDNGLYWKANINCPTRGCDVFHLPPNALQVDKRRAASECADHKIPFECKPGFYMKVKVRCLSGYILSYVHTCVEEKKTPPTQPPPPPPKKCKRKLEVVFVIDASATIGNNHFLTMIEDIKSSVDDWSVSDQNTHIGAVIYAGKVQKSIPLTGSAQQFESQLTKFKYLGGKTVTYKGVGTALKVLKKARKNVQKIMIVVTDGQSQKKRYLRFIMNKAKKTDILFMSIGVGSKLNRKELNMIASKEKFSYEAEDYSKFSETLKKMVKAACNDKF